MSGFVPDYVAPVEGWRAWSVVRGEHGVYLRSLYVDVPWEAGAALVATCRRTCRRVLRPWRTYLPSHPAPTFGCTCGVYAAFEPGPILTLLTSYSPRQDEIVRTIGRVALWGDVVECTRGWRASHAYPSHLWLWPPVTSSRRRSERLDVVADELSSYAVPVERVEASAPGELLAALTLG